MKKAASEKQIPKLPSAKDLFDRINQTNRLTNDNIQDVEDVKDIEDLDNFNDEDIPFEEFGMFENPPELGLKDEDADDDFEIKIADDYTIFQKLPDLEDQTKASRPKVIRSKPRSARRLLWVYDQAGQLITHVPENVIDSNQAINNLMISGLIFGSYQDFETRDYFHCPDCGLRLEDFPDNCPHCDKQFTD